MSSPWGTRPACRMESHAGGVRHGMSSWGTRPACHSNGNRTPEAYATRMGSSVGYASRVPFSMNRTPEAYATRMRLPWGTRPACHFEWNRTPEAYATQDGSSVGYASRVPFEWNRTPDAYATEWVLPWGTRPACHSSGTHAGRVRHGWVLPWGTRPACHFRKNRTPEAYATEWVWGTRPACHLGPQNRTPDAYATGWDPVGYASRVPSSHTPLLLARSLTEGRVGGVDEGAVDLAAVGAAAVAGVLDHVDGDQPRLGSMHMLSSRPPPWPQAPTEHRTARRRGSCARSTSPGRSRPRPCRR